MSFQSLAYDFVEEIEAYEYQLSSSDHVWNLILLDYRDRWQRLHVNKYQQTFYISHVDGDGGGLEVKPRKSVQAMTLLGDSSDEPLDVLAKTWQPLLESARRWIKVVRRDWIRAMRQVRENYPLNHRYGIVPNALIRASLPDVYRLDESLGKAKSRKLVGLVESGIFFSDENTVVPAMTAARYFEYCKIAYVAGRRRDERVDASLSGREMYERYADGRHEGLLDIDEASESDFAAWLDGTHPKRARGGHPWEIKRGGNTTHIDLSVTRPSLYDKERFKIELRGASIGRMVETMKMFLAIHDASLPISIADPEGVRKRLLALDNIGLVPKYLPLHRANQRFAEEDDVYDVMYYDDLGRFKRRIKPFISWEPLPLFRPR